MGADRGAEGVVPRRNGSRMNNEDDLREVVRKTSDVADDCQDLLDLAGVPPGSLTERVRWLVREYRMPGWHELGQTTAGGQNDAST